MARENIDTEQVPDDTTGMRQYLARIRADFDAHNHDGANSKRFQTMKSETVSARTVSVRKTSFTDTTSGLWTGLVGTIAKFFLGSSSSYLKFDGTDLTFTGKSRQLLRISTIFESSTRFTTAGSGTATFGDRGLSISPTTTQNRAIEVNIPVNNTGTGSTGFDSFEDTAFTAVVTLATEYTGDGWFYIGITENNTLLTGSSTTGAFAKKQYGFKAFKGSGQTIVYATSGNGTTEEQTSLFEISGAQTYFLSAVCSSSGSVTFKAIFGGLSSGTVYSATHSVFPPATATYSIGTFFVNNQGSNTDFNWIINSYSFEKFSNNFL